MSAFPHVPQCGLGGPSIGRIDEDGNSNGLGHQVMQEPQPLGRNLRVKKIDAGQVAARPGETGDKTKPNRVFTDTEDNGNRCGRSFGRERTRRVGGRGDHGRSPADQIGHQRRQATVLTLQPVVFDRHVLSFDVAGFVEALAERGRTGCGAIGRPAVRLKNLCVGISFPRCGQIVNEVCSFLFGGKQSVRRQLVDDVRQLLAKVVRCLVWSGAEDETRPGIGAQ